MGKTVRGSETTIVTDTGDAYVVSAKLPFDNKHVISVNTTAPAGSSYIFVRYMEVASGVTFTIGADADIEIT